MNEAGSRPRTIDRDQATRLMEPLTDLVVKAGQAILAVSRDTKINDKSDGSPVTEADLAADHVIREGLAQLIADVPAVSEERTQPGKAAPYLGSFFLIDPLDGTKEFVAGRDEFTINLALITNGAPLLGIIGAPALGWLWRGVVGYGAERVPLTGARAGMAERIRTRPAPKRGKPWVTAVSRSHGDANTEAFIAARRGAVRMPLGSAVKFGRIAEGAVDIYPRLAPTSEWDIAAGHAIVTAAGGKVTGALGEQLWFGEGNSDFIVPAFIAWGDPAASSSS
jgi:3'(2'), 5'-bisphosphate nucleotidase